MRTRSSLGMATVLGFYFVFSVMGTVEKLL
jgi:hypothetical protein